MGNWKIENEGSSWLISCFLKCISFFPSETTTPPPKQRLFTYSARKLATPDISTGPKCELLTLAVCKSLGYNFTKVPNPLQHKTYHQAATQLSTLLSKFQSHCSPHLVPFLCRLYLPPCILPQTASPPCRSLCESVQEDCALLSSLESWPGHLNCEQFPRANEQEKCFLGSTKVTSKRTTLIRGTSEKKEILTETNTLKTATSNVNQISYPTKPVKISYPTKPVKIGENVGVKTEAGHTTAKPGKEKTVQPSLNTAAGKSESRQMTDKSPASFTTGKPSSFRGKEMSNRTRQTNVSASTTVPTKTSVTSKYFGGNVAASSASSENKGGMYMTRSVVLSK